MSQYSTYQTGPLKPQSKLPRTLTAIKISLLGILDRAMASLTGTSSLEEENNLCKNPSIPFKYFIDTRSSLQKRSQGRIQTDATDANASVSPT